LKFRLAPCFSEYLCNSSSEMVLNRLKNRHLLFADYKFSLNEFFPKKLEVRLG